MKNSLSPSEWILATSFLIFIAALVLIAKVNTYKASTAIASATLLPEEILVTIDGAVKKPGQYTIQAGITIEQALRKAKPAPEADLKALPLKEIIENPLHITVGELKEIRVTVAGAIAGPVELVLPPKSRISDLKSKVIFTDETEKTFFRRRKLLKNGEHIEVPKKTVEQNEAH